MSETRIVDGRKLENILDNYDLDYSIIDLRYRFVGVDHDLWEFEAIIHHTLDDKYFSVNWFDCYNLTWDELGLNEEDYELIEVFPKQVMTTIYR
jgi:hypothetical protein